VRAAAVLLALAGCSLVRGPERPRGHITLTAVTRPVLDGRDVEAEVSLANNGTVTAWNVRVGFALGDRTTAAPAGFTLEPGKETHVPLVLPGAAPGPGEWPFRTTIDYQDRSGYWFQAVHMGTVANGACKRRDVVVSRLDTVRVPRDGQASLAYCIANDGKDVRTVSVGVETTADIGRPDRGPAMVLEPRARQCTTVSLRNVYGLARSRYPLFVIAEYEDRCGHRTVIGRGQVEVVD